MSKKVFLTGGTGFIGANVARSLVARGYEVVCLTRRSSPGLCLEGLPVQLVQADLNDLSALSRAMEGCEDIYHLAGVFDASPQGKQLMQAVHVDGTRQLCEASLKVGARRFLLCSSSVTVGYGPLSAPGDEDSAPPDLDSIYGHDGPLRWYHDSKAEAEQLVHSFHARGLETVTVNPDYIIGAWDIKPTSGALVLTIAKGWIPFYPRGGKCFQDVEDCAEGHVLAMEKGRVGERYLLGNENHSYRSFMSIIGQVVGRRPPLLPMPRLAGEALGLVGAVGNRFDAHRFTGLNRYVLRSMAQERYRSGDKAVRELGVPQTPLYVAVEKAHRWFRDHGYLD
jgi:dihydroflavonol-4-reductase